MDKLLEKAVEFHGHKCSGIAIGVRAAAEAKRILEIEDIHAKGIYCIAEQTGCYLDAIQLFMGCTAGNGNLIIRDTGKCVFNFFDLNTGKALRLAKRDTDSELHGDDKIDFIIHAPLEDVFTVGEPFIPAPGKRPKFRRVKCAVCGEETMENRLVVRDGKAVCIDCAERR